MIVIKIYNIIYKVKKYFFLAIALLLICEIINIPALRPLYLSYAIESSKTWIFTDLDKLSDNSKFKIEAFYRVKKRYIEYGEANLLYKRLVLANKKSMSEIEFANYLLIETRKIHLTQNDVWHNLTVWPSIVTGLGWCNQINETAAMVLAQHFGSVEIVVITDPVTKIGHTIGRLHLKENNEIIYYDIWGNNVVVFVNKKGKLNYYYNSSPLKNKKLNQNGELMLLRMYSNTDNLKIVNVFTSNLYDFIFLRLKTKIVSYISRNESSVEESALIVNKVALPLVPFGKEFLEYYLRARVNHLNGDLIGAIKFYKLASEVEGSNDSVLGKAARYFVNELK